MNTRNQRLPAASLSRREVVSAAGVLAAAGMAGAPPFARAAAPRIEITQGNLQPMPIALPDFIGRNCGRRRGRAQRHPGHHRQSQALGTVRADRSCRLSRADHQQRCRSALSRLAYHQRAGAGRRSPCAPGRRPLPDPIPIVGRDRRAVSDRAAILRPVGALAPHRPHHLRSGVRAVDRRQGLFRHPHRLRRRDRPEGTPDQAARHHGPGRRRGALPDARRRTRAHAALLPVQGRAGDHLCVLRQPRSARGAAQHRFEPARGGRQLPRE